MLDRLFDQIGCLPIALTTIATLLLPVIMMNFSGFDAFKSQDWWEKSGVFLILFLCLKSIKYSFRCYIFLQLIKLAICAGEYF